MKEKLKNKFYSIMAILLTVLLFCSVFTIPVEKKIAKADAAQTFTGFSGNNISETDLYNQTNTYDYKGSNTDQNSLYEYYDTSVNGKNTNTVKEGAPQITVLTHGLGGDAFHWSNVKDSYGDPVFAYDEESLFVRLQQESAKNGGVGANLYWAKMTGKKSFCLIDLENNYESDKIYKTQAAENTISEITDVSKHIIIVFEASNPNGYNYEVYEEFNYMLSKIVYDVKYMNGGQLPRINLIGHSRGGLTNLQYALDHPDLVDSLFGIGTPYFGSDTASTDLGAVFTNNANGREDIIDRNVYVSYFNRYYENYDRLYRNINAYALGGYSDTDFVFDALISSDLKDIEDRVSDEILLLCKIAIKNSPGIVGYISTAADLADMLISLCRDENYDEYDIESIVQIIADIELWDENSDLWDNLWQRFIFEGSPYFMNDLLVDLSSQIGVDEHSDTWRSYGFKIYTKQFEKIGKCSNPAMPAVVHNLEARDKSFINYILRNINIGTGTNSFLYEKIDETTISILGYKGDWENEIFVIPDTIDGYTVTEIEERAFDSYFVDKGITQIQLPASLTKIGDYAFCNCTELVNVLYGTSSQLVGIGASAFYGCSSLTQFGSTSNRITIPTGVTAIGSGAFALTGVQYVSIPASVSHIGLTAFAYIENLKTITVNSANTTYQSINGNLYNRSGGLLQYAIGATATSFLLPDDVTYIAPYAFAGEKDLISLDFNQVISIADGAFFACESLASCQNGGNIEYVAPTAFLDTPVLNNAGDFIVFGKLLFKYQGEAEIITKDMFPSSVERIAEFAFHNIEAKEIYLPLKVNFISDNAFSACQNLEKVQFENTQFPFINDEIFQGLNADFRFYCARSLINGMSNNEKWQKYSSISLPIKTVAYFEGIDKEYEFYYSENAVFPTETIPGKYIKGWYEVIGGEITNNRLSEIQWNRVDQNVVYRADTVELITFNLIFVNGESTVDAIKINTGDTFVFNRYNYEINGEEYSFVQPSQMESFFYNNQRIDNKDDKYCTFEGWVYNGSDLNSGQWLSEATDHSLYVYAMWAPVSYTATLYDINGSIYSEIDYTYFSSIELSPLESEVYRFNYWMDETNSKVDKLGNRIGDFNLYPNVSRLYTVELKSIAHLIETEEIRGIVGEKITLPQWEVENYEVKKWDIYLANSDYTIVGDITLLAEWGGVEYNIYYRNLTFQGQEASVIVGHNTTVMAPNYYEYGQVFLSKDITAFYSNPSPYQSHLIFVEWCWDSALTNPVEENVSTTENKDFIFYAKWRYDLAYQIREGTHTITDNTNRFGQPYDQVYIGMKQSNLSADLAAIGITKFYVKLKIRLWEVNDGYQRLYLYADKNGVFDSNNYIDLSKGKIEFDHGGTGAEETPGIRCYLFEIPLDKIKDSNYLYLLCSADGTGEDTWKNNCVYFEISFATTQSDLVSPEFTWKYKDPLSSKDTYNEIITVS